MDGFVKVLAYNNPITNEHPIIGVEIFGDGANELIQLASILLQTGATLKQVAATPFAAVTLSGLFQTASDDCLDKFADSAPDDSAVPGRHFLYLLHNSLHTAVYDELIRTTEL